MFLRFVWLGFEILGHRDCLHAERLFCTVGVHPTRCKEIEDSPQGPDAYWDALNVLLQDNKASAKIVAIGECGLDYDRYQSLGFLSSMGNCFQSVRVSQRTASHGCISTIVWLAEV